MVDKQSVALYIRVSTEEQVHGFSLEAQKATLYDHCCKTQTNVYKLYVDAGLSGKSISGRPSLIELLEDARKGLFQQVICLRLNRISRNLTDLLYITELFEKHGVTLHSLMEHLQTDTPMGKFALQMLGSVAEHERAQIAQNVRLGMQRRNRLGKWNSGNQVLGYQWVPHSVNHSLSRVEIIPDEEKLVRKIFTWYARGLGLKAIVNRLNSSGVRTKRGKTFSSISVRGILTNVNYIGKVAYTDSNAPGRKKIVEGEHKPIITMKLWEQVQLRLASRSQPSSKVITDTFPLTGILKCPGCGSGMIASHVSRTRKNGMRYIDRYYICSRYSSGGRAVCKPHHVRADQAENLVSRHVQKFLCHPTIAEKLAIELNQKRDRKLEPFRERIKEIGDQISALKKRNLRCYELFEDGHIDSQELKNKLLNLQSEISILEQEQTELERRIDSDPEQPIPIDRIRRVLSDFQPVLQGATPTQQKSLFRRMIAKITLPANRDISKAVIHGSEALLNLKISTN